MFNGGNNIVWVQIKDIVEFLYYISGIGLLTTVILGIIQLKVLKKDLHDRNKRAAVEKSLELLAFFSDHFFPAVSEYTAKVKTENGKPCDTKSYFDGKFYINLKDLPKELMVESIIKDKCGLTHLLNKLEFFSIAILNSVADENLIYTPVAGSFCDFVEREHINISVMRANGIPFKNLIDLYEKWKKKMAVEKAILQKLEADDKIKEIGNGHEFKKPIGL